ncbi:DEAD/DEAH box helicase [Candidatus Woesearchaeota archaeon]|jgi:superfamily II RNA helicase|nr:DEAD/DEAH box helicase [Candidatus Woesearchaeota archaeon]MBT5740248.1 DEAD/DEAH box helicase [Candidatus Woesearchaeota archaeon]
MKFKTFTLDRFQEEAVHAIEDNQSVVVSAPTGSGKTLIADYIIDKYKNEPNCRIIYTAPIKALSNQKYKDFSKEFGEENVGLMTGDIVINPSAKVVIMTTEIYRNMVVSNDKEELKQIAYVIFDEVHYINDIERGYVWEESVIYSSESVRFLCLSATIPNAKEFANWIQAIKKHKVATVVETKRNVPLKHMFFDYELGITTLEKIKAAKDTPEYRQVFKKRGGKRQFIPEPDHVELIKELGFEKLPCFFFSFSRKDCQKKAQELSRSGMFKRNPKILPIIQKKLSNAPSDISKLQSTTLIKETLQRGIGFHHAGLLPVIKELVEELFAQGLIQVLYTTETFAVGINMPAKTVCFAALRKYDGIGFRTLNTKEYFQIAGRAGRRGIDTHGFVVSMIFRPKFRYNEIKTLTAKDIEPIHSQFRLSVNTVLNLINLHTPEEIEKILRLSFFSYQKFGEEYENVPTKKLLARYNSIRRKLEKLDFVRGNELTPKGEFASHIYADEITLGEVFSTGLHESLDEYQILLLLAAVVYEPRERDEFKQKFRNEQLQELKTLLKNDEWLAREKKFLSLDVMTTIINPIYNGKSFFDVMKFTSLVEGDLIRLYSQILDRIGQIKKAGYDHTLATKMSNCQGIVKRALEGIYLV